MYNNIIRPGIRTTTSVNPRAVVEDIDESIRVLSPHATPVLTLGRYLGRGPKPKGHKIQVAQYDSFNHFDYVNRVVLASSIPAYSNGYERFAKIFLTQPSRPAMGNTMIYQPQDKFAIHATGQTVQVVMTPRGSMPLSTSGQQYYKFDTAFTGATDSTCEEGSVIVRTTTASPFLNFSKSDVTFLDRTIWESQRIQAESTQRDFYYDCNFVERKEKVLHMTDDQKEWVMTKGKKPDWNFQQEQMLEEFKMSIEHAIMWGERAVDLTADRPMHHMQGLFHAIKSNVAYYNPDSTTSFEQMFKNFCYDMAFRYNPNGNKKVALCGGRVLQNINDEFRDFRQLSGANPSDKKAGLDIDTYVIPGGLELKLIRSELLQQNSALENWCFVIDPNEMEQRIVRDFKSRFYQGNDERDYKLMVEWQGTIAWHIEQTHALLRTNA